MAAAEHSQGDYCVKFVRLLVVCAFVSFALPVQSYAMPDSFADLAESQADAVVNISTTQIVKGQAGGLPPGFGFPPGSPFEQFFHDFQQNQPEQERHALGTGFIISPDGYVVTNNHVVQEATEVVVKLRDGKEYKAKVIGTDEKLDVGLLKIDAKNLHTVKLGDSDKLRVGDWVVAIGNPFGLEQTVTAGIVSAKGRVIGAGPYDSFIQTDAAINPGNSGGPLFNVNGEVVGINTAIYSRSGGNNGIGFAIPIAMAQSVIQELRDTGHVTRARLGVFIAEVDKETMQALGLKDNRGALVRQVENGSAADKAGIKPGDVIVTVDGKPIEHVHELPMKIASHRPGDKVEVGLIRDGKAMTRTVEVEKMPESDSAKQEDVKNPVRLGLALSTLDADTAASLQTAVKEGVVVQQVVQGSPAQRAGIARGDVIFSVNRKPVTSVKQFMAMAEEFKAGDVLQLLLDRQGSTVFAVLRLPKEPEE
ncbi:MAG: trypsin [Zetaproteobacteria bacterium CG06_land_8_20_14_3_00_59_53]|nr:MAG: trypsin [Zetaproteobacteria bacterium CG23_combo_of_CG06-09_8_20_14_all_59_86]PIQ65081.1 MAG: trypsin [Zetaproteobacteria bacterium CG11_big_fil_rev_8_21_14_0_20_59_439]PIU70166.1 MAG: trypsin [Zetaproteobacteria bacterium CG06_land_8_20_14_3_00_59_53]PIU96137.1 MAG: trypsin [Zetaproteobacteria bacterium CG03_land_8_20_14_0_80_59_51]PIY44925.1 MAG: trypsin [Zetaproteobacteria bacterium CG_4_10_14_0_8_um_filter_59_127]PJC17965.1 MAG: trypsin [Zetaproteobacteria bacterium CG_4_9_14_0_2_u